MQTPLPTWEDIAWLREQWGGPFMLKGLMRVDDARRAVDARHRDLGAVLDIIGSGIDSALLGRGHSSVQDLSPADLVNPDGFYRDLGAGPGLTQP
jgi:isopentenyl diphosphate isomerase/L-lactate dehydrogenase-like FMN-dependent dehydrogenase